jgi:hypothetical protein
MSTGREKIEAALSPHGTAEIPAVICYEGIYTRDHWDQLFDCPWWYSLSPDLEHQLAWRGQLIEKTGQDWFYLTSCDADEIRAISYDGSDNPSPDPKYYSYFLL